MIDILIDLIGQAPAGFEFLMYIFSFILVLAVLYIIYNCTVAIIDLFK